MEEKEYENVLLFTGVLTTRGFPESLRKALDEEFGPIDIVSPSIPFSFTDYYVPEMGEGIERFFISFRNLVSPDSLKDAKLFTNRLEKEWGGREEEDKPRPRNSQCGIRNTGHDEEPFAPYRNRLQTLCRSDSDLSE